MIKVDYMPTVKGTDIEKELNISIFDCEFASMAENGGYELLPLDDKHIQDLQDEIADCDDGTEYKYVTAIKNDLKVIQYFRENGFTDAILVNISW